MVFTDVVMTSAVCNAWCRKLNTHGTVCLLIFFIASNSWVCELRNSSLVTVWVANTCLVLSKEYIIWCGKDSVKVNCNSSLLVTAFKVNILTHKIALQQLNGKHWLLSHGGNQWWQSQNKVYINYCLICRCGKLHVIVKVKMLRSQPDLLHDCFRDMNPCYGLHLSALTVSLLQF